MNEINDKYPEFFYDKILQETEKAILFDIYGDETLNLWIPKSQMEHDEENCKFNIPSWLAIDKELI